MEAKTDNPEECEFTYLTEGKATLSFLKEGKIFYNPIQEVNRDISVLGIQTFLDTFGTIVLPRKFTILEAMSASGIRAVRYAKELTGITSIVANDLSKNAVESIKRNAAENNVEEMLEITCKDAIDLMYSRRNKHFVVDIDPYGSPAPFLDSSIQCVEHGGLLIVTATDMAILAGNNAETCYAKYGAVSLKSNACQEIAQRIMIHSVQSTANKYGIYMEPLLSLKIDFYIRIFFRAMKSPDACKTTVCKTAMIYQCPGCQSLNHESLMKTSTLESTVPQVCEICESKFHIGGPVWSGPIHNKGFVEEMLRSLQSGFSYLNTSSRILGMLSVILEELHTFLLYDLSQICSVIKCTTIPILKFRSAIMNQGYKISGTHVSASAFKTNAPNKVIWDILREWYHKIDRKENKVRPDTPMFRILSKPVETKDISFKIREDANPTCREKGIVRFQCNPTANWGPGVRASLNTNAAKVKREKNQGKRQQGKREKNQGKHQQGKREKNQGKHQQGKCEKPSYLSENGKQIEEDGEAGSTTKSETMMIDVPDSEAKPPLPQKQDF